MAVPKGKQSKQRTNTRFANFKATAPTLVECPHCHELKQPHKAVSYTHLLRCRPSSNRRRWLSRRYLPPIRTRNERARRSDRVR